MASPCGFVEHRQRSKTVPRLSLSVPQEGAPEKRTTANRWIEALNERDRRQSHQGFSRPGRDATSRITPSSRSGIEGFGTTASNSCCN